MIDFTVTSGHGLDVTLDSVPIVRGSWFQYYAPGWTKGYYSSTWNPQTVITKPDGSTDVTFRSNDGRAHGTIRYAKRADGLTATYRLHWEGEEPAKIELTPGMVWAPAFAAGSAEPAGGQGSVKLASRTFTSDADRKLGVAPSWTFSAPFARMKVAGSSPFEVLDGRNGFKQDWAQDRPTFWIGAQSLDVAKGTPTELTVDWTFTKNGLAATPAPTVRFSTRAMAVVASAPEGPAPLVPEPKRMALSYDRPIAIDGRFTFPLGRPRLMNEFDAALARRFRSIPATAAVKSFDGGVSKLGLKPGGYRISITSNGATVLGEYGPASGRGESRGLRMGLRRLADLAYAKNGRLWLPTGTIEDWPSVPTRGVHLFVGPVAPEFQKRLWDRALLPLGFDQVVLQCERTAWNATPKLRGAGIMEKKELGALFDWYRSKEVDPIPLIQSLGHAEWMFAGGANRDLAVNPAVPYTIDPRKPGGQDLVARLWAETIALTKPKTLHFGLDEIDMRGFPSGAAGEELATELWEKQLPFLSDIAKRAGARTMLWGDMALHKSEAPDATNAADVATAVRRRNAIPKGAFIADWHYKADARASTFYPVLQLWKREGFRPVASSWFRPENIRGFNLAADLENVGSLQTTWAGYESNEESLLRNPDQYAAMVLAGDYSWSARQTPLDKLDYDPMEVLRAKLYAGPAPVVGRSGSALTWGEADPYSKGGYGWMVAREPLRLFDPLTGTGNRSVTIPAKAGRLRLLVSAPGQRDSGMVLGRIEAMGAKIASKTLAYGRHLRSKEDPGVALLGDRSGDRWVVDMQLPVGTKSVRVTSDGAVGGFEIWAATVENSAVASR